ncbi:MAG: glycosyltransferase family 2 protein [Candidatus Daviesbacteria bacterium]|nr:glycosyltransferase family 2 protein [Candidatus Daviesbacteria bacterium]
MLYVYYILLIYSYFRGLRGCYRTLRSIKYVKNTDFRAKKTRRSQSILFHIIIPVLREQEIIEETIKHFSKLKGNYFVYFVTTSKEDFDKENNKHIHPKYKTFPTTKEVILKYLKNRPELKAKVKLINYPQKSGRLAHQFNYALKIIRNQTKDSDYVIIYNADSRVKSNILEYYLAVIDENPDCLVIQQSAAFLANFNKLPSFLKGISLLQTRWTLAHEVPRILRTHGLFGFTEGAHVVSHGLCIQYKFLTSMHGFPTSYLNEDLPLGYFIRLYGAKIYLLKNLENADTPTSIKSMFNQYRTWFYGVSYYPIYIYDALRLKEVNKIFAVIWGVKYLFRGFLWLNLSLAWLLIFMLPILLGKPYLEIFSVLSFIIYAPLSFLIIYWKLSDNFRIKRDLIPILLSPIVYLTHSFGPILATCDMIASIVCGRPIYKNKTER